MVIGYVIFCQNICNSKAQFLSKRCGNHCHMTSNHTVTWSHHTITWPHHTVTWRHHTVTWRHHTVTWRHHTVTWRNTVFLYRLTLLVILYITFGVCGYMSFGHTTMQIITLNLPDGIVPNIVRLCLSFSLFFTYPSITIL